MLTVHRAVVFLLSWVLQCAEVNMWNQGGKNLGLIHLGIAKDFSLSLTSCWFLQLSKSFAPFMLWYSYALRLKAWSRSQDQMKISIAFDFTDYTWVVLIAFKICESETLSVVSLTRLLSRQADFSMHQLMVKLLEVNCMFPKLNPEVFQIVLQGLCLHDLNLID